MLAAVFAEYLAGLAHSELSYYQSSGDSTLTESRTKRSQLLPAWFCLVAALLLFAPLVGAAWSAHAAACCTGDHCPIPEHHHSKAPAHGADCEHQAGGVTACTMNCCQNAEHVMLVATTFVVPDGTLLPELKLTNSTEPVAGANRLPRSLEVLSPPPRASATAK